MKTSHDESTETPGSPAEEILRQAHQHADTLTDMSQTQPTRSQCEACPAIVMQNETALAVAHVIRMLSPIYKAFYNGGLPSKRGGKYVTIQTPLGQIRISGMDASTWVFRILVFLILLRLAGYQVNLRHTLDVLGITQMAEQADKDKGDNK